MELATLTRIVSLVPKTVGYVHPEVLVQMVSVYFLKMKIPVLKIVAPPLLLELRNVVKVLVPMEIHIGLIVVQIVLLSLVLVGMILLVKTIRQTVPKAVVHLEIVLPLFTVVQMLLLIVE